MLASQSAIEAFAAAITVYLGCLETENNEALAANPTLTEEQKRERRKILRQKQNAAAVDAQTWADDFNAQVTIWNQAASGQRTVASAPTAQSVLAR
ncbi:MAG: hypothetical protein FGM43_10200 [Sinobacteraceae bacterium]|nr:hypothetical protein [Nevskiaceae bacterium]